MEVRIESVIIGLMIKTVLKYTLQPLLVIGVLWYWAAHIDDPTVYPLLLVAVHLVLGSLEHLYPARTHWIQRWREKLLLITLVLVLTTGTVLVASVYDAVLRQPLADLRTALGADIWPHQWPLMVQLFMVFFASEFIWYWVHRAEHRWHGFWRLSGHGAHHSFKHLGAINFGANHPFELMWIVLPSALVELFFGVGMAAAGASLLGATQASIAHANLDLNTRVVGWLFTTNRYHIRHHSAVLEESNTNYGCAAIVWDRVFGTFADSTVQEAGIGPTEPNLWAKWMMPFREPQDSQVAPN